MRSRPCPRLTAILILLVLGTTGATHPQEVRRSRLGEGQTADVLEWMLPGGNRLPRALERIELHRDTRFVAPLIELLRFDLRLPEGTVGELLRLLTGQRYGEDWHAWYEWLGRQERVELPPGFATWKGRFYAAAVDPAMSRFLDSRHPGTLRVELVQWGGVAVDGIPALDQPKHLRAGQATYLAAEDLVFGVELGGDARAYPLRILDWHEMTNDVVGGVPVALAYCTLCGAGVLYDTRVAGAPHVFGSSGFLYESNKLMFDRQTYTLWNQLTGEPVLGTLAGRGIVLRRLPVVVTTWGRWRRKHPDTKVLSLDTGHDRDYRPGRPYGKYFASPDTMFPVARRSKLLPPKAWVYTLLLEGVPKAYPLSALEREGVVHDTLAGRPVVLVTGPPGTREVRAYEGGGHRFTRPTEGGDRLVDEKGRAWRVDEESLAGPDNQSLPRLGGHLAYWFGWFSFYPRTELYGVGGG